jgi:V/A-type H+-transporting ATPase subunit K
MNELTILLGWVGIYGILAFGAIGSIIGCAIAGQAAIGAMMDVEGGYGKYVGVSAMPSTMIIFGIVVMFTPNRAVTVQNGGALFAIGVLGGIALLLCGVWQGRTVASCIAAAKDKPEIFGLSLAPAAIVEGYAVFVFVFALVLAGSIPGAPVTGA